MAFDMTALTPRIVRDELAKHKVGANIIDRIVFMAEKYNSPAYSAHMDKDNVSRLTFLQQTAVYVGLAKNYSALLIYRMNSNE